MKTSAWRRWRTILLAGLAACCAAVTILAALLACRPDFYDVAVAAARGGADVEARARRMVTKASALHASLFRPGRGGGADGPERWEAVIEANECNAWLALDLPRSHSHWLPRGLSAPGIAFLPRHARVGIRVGTGPLSAVVWVEAEIVLRDVNQVAIAIERACVGAIPLPRAAVMRELAGRLERLGVVTDLRWLDGRLVLLATIAGADSSAAGRVRIESLSLTAGELIVAGSIAPAARQPAGAAGGLPGR